jgi:subtilisin family serine protease
MQKLFLAAILATLLGGSLATAATYENPSVVGQVQDRIVVIVEPGVTLAADKAAGVPQTGNADLDALALRFEATEVAQLYGGLIDKFAKASAREEMARWYAVDFARDVDDLDAVIAAYEKAAGVAEVKAIDICKNYGTAFFPDDLSSSQYYLRNTDLGGADIRALGGWAEASGDSSIIVAIADSGVDWNHPDLGGTHPDRVNGAIWTNWAEYYGEAGRDDDSNGYVDDIRGWDWVTGVNGYPDEDDQTPDNDPSDYESHGTNCAGVVAPLTNNGIGIAGIAHGCKMMALRIGWLPNGTTQGVVRMDWASQAMLYAAAKGAKIFNASWGSSSFLSFSTQQFLNTGGIIFTAAGNDSADEPSYLGAYNNDRVVAVAATNSNDGKADFSNYGSWVDIAAPGVGIYTTAYNAASGQSTYGTTQGTSFSSPLAAGAAALIWSSNLSLTGQQVVDILKDSADNIDAQNPGFEGLLGAGRVNVLKALGDGQHNVPGEFLDFVDAANSASEGDVVKVLGGEAIGPIVIPPKDIEILGGWDATYTTRDPVANPTIIQGTPSQRGVQFQANAGPACVFDGFQVEGGSGSFRSSPYSGEYGGGILVNRASPTLRNLVVTGNEAGNASTLGLGGGIALLESDAVIENVTVSGNSGIYGAGMFIYKGAPSLVNVAVVDNSVITENVLNPSLGGGVHIVDSEPVLTDVTVSGHLGSLEGGGIYVGELDLTSSLTMIGGEVSGNTATDNGGGLRLAGGTHDLQDVLIGGNSESAAATFMSGGGLFATAATVSISGATVADNSAQVAAGLQFEGCPDVDVTSTVLSGNQTVFFGGTLNATNSPDVVLTNLTLADNSSTGGGAGIFASASALTISNTISAFNTGGTNSANGIHFSGGATGVLSCNNVFGNDGDQYGGITDPTGSDGNISADPQFCDQAAGDYGVADTSPCAPDQSGGCGLIGALEAGCGTSTPVEDPQVPVAFAVDQAFPNPFNPMTTIRFSLPSAAHTRVVVFDVRGRLVRTLVDGQLDAATHSVQWRGDDDGGRSVSAGVYFYRVTSGEQTATGRMALVK